MLRPTSSIFRSPRYVSPKALDHLCISGTDLRCMVIPPLLPFFGRCSKIILRVELHAVGREEGAIYLSFFPVPYTLYFILYTLAGKES